MYNGEGTIVRRLSVLYATENRVCHNEILEVGAMVQYSQGTISASVQQTYRYPSKA